MKKFLFTYWIGIILLFALFYWEYSPISNIINNYQTNLTSLLTSFSLEEGIMEAHRIFITEHYALVIEKACNGMVPFLFFLASILAFPSSIIHKIKWAIMGYLFISAMNVFRIWFVTQLVMQSKNNFSLAHDYLGNALLILTGLILFTSFIKTRNKTQEAKEVVTQTKQTLHRTL
ncbi:MAG: Unknown protein [uncultured Sulfurovum sp.]|uniref:Exosortase/archaeosortase family protein n=1 Tax=uncultured Sulfurovum sp. TaxID=269237 RepID=A0A6S6U2B6_9BACT|nr:MAG: Unknown protein [uncultured Sulfurovum sp.]